jgi:hypothetical protein
MLSSVWLMAIRFVCRAVNGHVGSQVYGFLNLASIRLKDLACDPVGRSVS